MSLQKSDRQLDELIRGAGRIAIGGHYHPDGDCAGAVTSLYRYIRKVCPKAALELYLEKIPDAYAFLGEGILIRHSDEGGGPADLFIALDCGGQDRLGFAAPVFERAKRTACIDHHISNTGFADVNYIDPDASSTSEMLADMMDPAAIDIDIARGLFLGIVHDTGVFQYSCASAKTHRIAASLLERGFDASELILKTYYEKTFSQQRVLGRAIGNAELYDSGRIIASSISLEEMRECGVLPEHLDGIVSLLRDTRGVECSVFIYEKEAGQWKVSFRSRQYPDVSLIARQFGGGGHMRAAGASVEAADPGEALGKIIPAVIRMMPGGEV